MSPPVAGAPPMRRWALRLEYDGTPFIGWQRQTGGLSVQQVLEEAAGRLSGGHPVPSVVAGRTDAGVHAEAQVASLALPDRLTAVQVRDALNTHMRPYPVVVLEAAAAPEGWSPRFSAIQRRYRYRILNRRSRPALLAHRAWHVRAPLDAAAMADGAERLVGPHDFTSFRAAACQAENPVRTLDRLEVRRDGEAIEIVAEARSFLHHQVRNMVGTLRLVGEGRWRAADVTAALAARDRAAAGPTAPAAGLFLAAVRYPTDPFAPTGADPIPAEAPGPRSTG